ncbi:hypothetical protein [Marvinbryantia formatexigens]|uniref:hypothetical protein n=1 Tax=Marvinbryantia formatexigens TaxID=168384 RepID=UPI0012F66A81|nr:hypothetical protein [Marvinbryantia formatexigens]
MYDFLHPGSGNPDACGFLRAAHSRNPGNIRNSHIFLRKMAAFSCFAGAKVIHSHAGMGCMTFCTLAVEILMPADFSVLRTPEILETFEIRTFFL